MLKNYIIVAFRNLKRNKIFTLINIAGLAVGIAVFLLIFEYIAAEWSSNRFHKNYNELYRVALENKTGDVSYYIAPGYAGILKDKFPAIKSAVTVADGIASGVISVNNDADHSFRDNRMLYVGADFLNVFSFPLIEGTSSLEDGQTLALSRSMALKLFGSVNVIGKTVTVSNQFGNTLYSVRSVYEDMPEQSDIQAGVLLSINTLKTAANRDDNDWADPNTLNSGFSNIYFLLDKNANAASLTTQINSFVQSRSDNDGGKAILQPFSELHLAPGFDYPYATFGNLSLVAGLLAVAILIMVIAWVNYINLSTVQSFTRFKETGVRKVLGASRAQLTAQYLSETFLLSFFAVLVSLALVTLMQDTFNGFAGKSLSLSTLNQGWFWYFAAATVLLGTLFSGAYVAFVLSSFKPVAAIKGKAENNHQGISLRKALVIFQFCVSVVFIIATIVIYNQVAYMKGNNSGLKLDQLLVLKGPTVSSEGQAAKNLAFKNALAQLPFVKKYSGSNNVPGNGYNFSADGITKLNPMKDDDKKSYNMAITDQRFFDTYGIQFVQGKAFSEEDALSGWTNSKKVILNEKAAAQLGFAKNENIIGRKIKWGSEFEIAGVVKDYHHLSMRQPIDPVIFLPSVSFVYFTIQTDAQNMQSKIATLNKLYKEYFPSNPFEYFFEDETYNAQYHADEQMGNISIAASLLAIIIACLGLFGLAAFTAKQRVKEIGIRKVLGATTLQVTQLISKDFLKLVFVGMVIAFPVAWFAMNKWLNSYAYRIDLEAWIFIVAGSAALLIALITVSMQAYKASLANPISNLRSE